MPTRATALAGSWLLVIASSCCCCGDCLPDYPQTYDEPEIERVARDYAQANREALLSDPDAAPGGSGECFSGGGSVAFDLGVAVLSRGHSGSGSTGQVTFDPVACARRIVVWVVLRGAAFVAIGAVVYDRVSGGELRRIGEIPSDYDEWAGPDSDHVSGELF